jgi:hypothetical protein
MHSAVTVQPSGSSIAMCGSLMEKMASLEPMIPQINSGLSRAMETGCGVELK